MALALMSKPKHVSTGRSASVRNKKAMPGRNQTFTRFRSDVAKIGLPTLAPGHPVIQAKLKIGEPNDKYEQEADRVADAVMRMPDSIAANRTIRTEPGISARIQRMCPECEAEEENIQTKVIHGQIPVLSPKSGKQISTLGSGGQPLPPSLRTFYEQRFGYDFSQVRIHNDRKAAELARTVNARAYTLGQRVVFGAGEYRTRTRDGRQLLAHELTHVIQQTGRGGLRVQRQVAGSSDRLNNGDLEECTSLVTNLRPPRNAREEIISAHDMAIQIVDMAIRFLRQERQTRLLIRHFGGTPRQNVLRRFQRIFRRLRPGPGIYRCVQMSDQVCMNQGEVGAYVECPSSGLRIIAICPRFFLQRPLQRAFLIIHEAAHSAGACLHEGKTIQNANAFQNFARQLVGPPARADTLLGNETNMRHL